MTETTQIVLAARPKGKPTAADFRLAHTALPDPGPGQMLVATRFLSLDPYMRGRMDDRASYAKPVAIGGVMEGQGVAQVVASHRDGFAAGDWVLAPTGWASHALSDGTGVRRLGPASLPSGAPPVSASLGVLGMPGFTAYAGLLVLGRPKPGETVVVAAATGPVGSLVGQLAREEGARVVAVAGGPAKVAYLRDTLRFDAALDHRAPDFAAQLAAACPGGIDVYFENVGGAVWQAVLPLLNLYARVPVCGLISQYSGGGALGERDLLPATMRQVLTRSLTIRGFINTEFVPEHFPAFLHRVGTGVAEGPDRASGGCGGRAGERAHRVHGHAGGAQLRQNAGAGELIWLVWCCVRRSIPWPSLSPAAPCCCTWGPLPSFSARSVLGPRWHPWWSIRSPAPTTCRTRRPAPRRARAR